MLARPTIAVVLALSVPTSLPAQDEQSARVSGAVLDRAGQPWANASVELVHRAHPKLPAAGAEHIVRAQTDARGRFRAMVRAGRDYGAWAWQDDGPRFRVTAFEQNVVPGVPLRLRESKRTYHDRRVRIVGLEAWKAHGPFSFEMLDRRTRPVLVRPLTLDDEHRVTLPPAPTGGVAIRIRGRGGRPIHDLYVPRTVEDMVTALKGRDPDNANPERAREVVESVADVRVPPPYPVVVRCVDKRTKKPIKDARIVIRPYTRLPEIHDATRTDARGLAVVDLAFTTSYGRTRFGGELLAYAHGYAEIDYRGYKIPIRPIEEQRKRITAGEHDVELEMLSGVDMRGRLLLDADTPASNAKLLLYANVEYGNGSSRFGIEARALSTDEAGHFVIPGRTGGSPYRVTLVLDTPTRRALAKRIGVDTPISSEILLDHGQTSTGKDLGDIRLDEFPRLQVTLRNPDGSPARATKLLWIDMRWPSDVKQAFFDPFHYPVQARCNRQGRATLLARSLDGIGIFAGDLRRGFVSHEVTGGEPNAKERAVELTLDPSLVVRGRLLDANEQPIPRGYIHLVSMRASGADPRLVRQASAFCSVHALRGVHARADADGRFTVVLPMTGVNLDFAIDGSGKRSHRHRIEFQKGTKPSAFEIVVPR